MKCKKCQHDASLHTNAGCCVAVAKDVRNNAEYCECDITINEHLYTLETAAREVRDGLSALYAMIVLNYKNATAVEAEEIANALRAKNKLTALLSEKKRGIV